MDDFKLKSLTNGMSSISNYIFFQQYTHCFVVLYLNISINTLCSCMVRLHGIHLQKCDSYAKTAPTEIWVENIKITLRKLDKHYHESADLYDVSVSKLAYNVLPRLKLWFSIYVFCLISTACDLFPNMTVIPSMNLHCNTTRSVLYTPNLHLCFTCFCYDLCWIICCVLSFVVQTIIRYTVFVIIIALTYIVNVLDKVQNCILSLQRYVVIFAFALTKYVFKEHNILINTVNINLSNIFVMDIFLQKYIF